MAQPLMMMMMMMMMVLSCLTEMRRPDALLSFIKLSQGNNKCDRLSTPRHPQLNFPDTWRMEPWASVHRLKKIIKK
jgi:hypothetical protein